MKFISINAETGENNNYTNNSIASFLEYHLEQYGDTIDAIQQCINYVMDPRKGGTIIVGTDNDKIVGVVILNNTGMKNYIPENILVYIAVDNSQRGKGYGQKLMQKAIDTTSGSIALHVEANNPALKLYEKLGFTNKYLEMRFTR